MDTARTLPLTKKDLPAELLAAATVISGVDEEIFIFGGFPKTEFDSALLEARRRWMLALKFDRALWLWSPGAEHTPREIARTTYGVADPESAEQAWLDAVWLWPDIEDQETVAEKFWSMHESVATAQARVARLRADAFIARQKKQIKAARKIEAKLANPKLRRRAAVNLQHLNPELWIRWTILGARIAKNTNRRHGWRENARVELGRIVPPTIGRQLDYDSLLVLLVFAECYRWIEKNKKDHGRVISYLREAAPARAGRAYILTSVVLKESGYPRCPGPKQIGKIVKSLKYLSLLKSSNSRR
jgi:hypothetical protein